MTETTHVELGGKSKYEVALQIAHNIILTIEGKKLADVSRDHYLKTVSHAINALNGHRD